MTAVTANAFNMTGTARKNPIEHEIDLYVLLLYFLKKLSGYFFEL